MKPTSRNNGHLRSDDGHTDTQTDRQTPNPLIGFSFSCVKMSLHLNTWSQNLTEAAPGGKNCVNCLQKNFNVKTLTKTVTRKVNNMGQKATAGLRYPVP